MFQLIEKAGQRKAVHSKSDLDYMRARGWQPIPQVVTAGGGGEMNAGTEVVVVGSKPKRKYTRKAK